MTDDLDHFTGANKPSATRPLAGLTVLVVEDSRFASEAVRLLCLRSGARIRRADCLRSADLHLRVYRPAIVLIDLGLPDGSGLDLIRELAKARPRITVVLATSGDINAESAALEAGADGFLAKPLESLGVFQQMVLGNLPLDLRPSGPRTVPNDEIRPDMIAYLDDMAHVADVMTNTSDDLTLDYIAQFLAGVARSANDGALEAAASVLANHRAAGKPFRSDLARVAGMVQARLENRAAV
jgi:CheY-like chemotaxis protein